MKNLIKILFAITLCLPFTLSAQWTDRGGYITTNDNVTIGSNTNSHPLLINKNSGGWQAIFDNRSSDANNPGSIVHISNGKGYGMAIKGQTTDDKYTLLLRNKNKWTNVFYNDGKVVLGLEGNVGIGTTTPGNKLEVNGTIRTKEIIVETVGWPDYVFYNDYDLPTLEEEEKHIEAKGHLLGFESEADMAGEIQLGDVTKRQQVKIEEVVLHLIKMEKTIEQLKEDNEQLKKQIAEK